MATETDIVATQEGVTQFQLMYHPVHHIECAHFAEMNGWRSYLYRLGLIGQTPERYQGYGFGNISHRSEPHSLHFVITGTQTGGLPLLCREHYCQVTHFELDKNQVTAKGPVKPSSESLTHASIYQANYAIQSVIHVHSPLIWQQAAMLDNLVTTSEKIPYGSPAMANAVMKIVDQQPNNRGAIAMLGHEDGVITYGESVQQSGSVLLDLLMQAHHLEANSEQR